MKAYIESENDCCYIIAVILSCITQYHRKPLNAAMLPVTRYVLLMIMHMYDRAA